MAKVILLVLLMGLSFNTTAQSKVEDDMLCKEAITHAFFFALQPDGRIVHAGAWHLIRREDLDNTQTYVALTVFHAMQQVSWNVFENPEKTKDNEEQFWVSVLNKANVECEYMLNELRWGT